jgi:hypothetical protein
MEVIVLNPNHPGAEMLPHEFDEMFGMSVHTLYVFKHYIIENNAPKRVFILCHSLGGDSTISVFEKWPEWVKTTVCAVAMTDAVVSPIEDTELTEWCFAHCVNWVRSGEKIDERLDDGPMCLVRSAATEDHPLTTFKAFPFIWDFFDNLAAGGRLPPRQATEEEEAGPVKDE